MTTRIKQHAGALLVGLALVAAGGLAGMTVSALVAPAPAVAHGCESDECDSFLIFWERCEDNPGKLTHCQKNGKDCTTDVCGHS